MTVLIKKADAEFGKALVGEARKQQQEELQKNVVGIVKATLDLIDRQERVIELLEKSKAALMKRVENMEAGNFTVVGTEIRYHDESKDIIRQDSLSMIVRHLEASIREVEGPNSGGIANPIGY